jgi:hypothetical protein
MNKHATTGEPWETVSCLSVVFGLVWFRLLVSWSGVGQGEARHRKYNGLNLGGGRAYDCSSDEAAVVANPGLTEHLYIVLKREFSMTYYTSTCDADTWQRQGILMTRISSSGQRECYIRITRITARVQLQKKKIIWFWGSRGLETRRTD